MTLNTARARIIEDYLSKIEQKPSKEIIDALWAERVILGMPPYEAHLAGGAFVYQVAADPEVWPEGIDPRRIIWAQTIKPDNSKISMTFNNETQFPNSGTQRFKAEFEKGKLVKITPKE